MSWPFGDLKPYSYSVILADPPWTFQAWCSGGWFNAPDGTRDYRPPSPKASRYNTLRDDDIAALPVMRLAAEDCVLFLWGCWPMLPQALRVISAWGFTYKTCGFVWMKANVRQIELFKDDADPDMLLGYWTRANTEFCLIGIRGNPKRLSAAVRQGIIEPRREHSRKPDCVHKRIEQLVAGPYCELFARAPRAGWDVWGNETDKFKAAAE
jgi:N6-adenosine-specific RNA methylase IME4